MRTLAGSIFYSSFQFLACNFYPSLFYVTTICTGLLLISLPCCEANAIVLLRNVFSNLLAFLQGCRMSGIFYPRLPKQFRKKSEKTVFYSVRICSKKKSSLDQMHAQQRFYRKYVVCTLKSGVWIFYPLPYPAFVK
jgi:hypothetical protein